jgi:hypothetical protein
MTTSRLATPAHRTGTLITHALTPSRSVRALDLQEWNRLYIVRFCFVCCLHSQALSKLD